MKVNRKYWSNQKSIFSHQIKEEVISGFFLRSSMMIVDSRKKFSGTKFEVLNSGKMDEIFRNVSETCIYLENFLKRSQW